MFLQSTGHKQPVGWMAPFLSAFSPRTFSPLFSGGWHLFFSLVHKVPLRFKIVYFWVCFSGSKDEVPGVDGTFALLSW